MHISGPAARWWQSVESRLSHVSWKIFRTHLLDRFGKDEHDLLIRKLFGQNNDNETIRQIT